MPPALPGEAERGGRASSRVHDALSPRGRARSSARPALAGWMVANAGRCDAARRWGDRLPRRRSPRRRSSTTTTPSSPANSRSRCAASLGMLLRHDEEVARHWGILPQRERERSRIGAIERAGKTAESRGTTRPTASEWSRRPRGGRPRKVSTTRGSKWCPRSAGSSPPRVLQRDGARIRAIEGHGVERVGHREDPRAERDVLSLEPQRVAGAVPPLVVMVASRAPHSRRKGTCSTSWRPISGWVRMIFHSAGVSGPGLSRMASGMPILPMSWRSTPCSRSRNPMSGSRGPGRAPA